MNAEIFYAGFEPRIVADHSDSADSIKKRDGLQGAWGVQESWGATDLTRRWHIAIDSTSNADQTMASMSGAWHDADSNIHKIWSPRGLRRTSVPGLNHFSCVSWISWLKTKRLSFVKYFRKPQKKQASFILPKKWLTHFSLWFRLSAVQHRLKAELQTEMQTRK